MIYHIICLNFLITITHGKQSMIHSGVCIESIFCHISPKYRQLFPLKVSRISGLFLDIFNVFQDMSRILDKSRNSGRGWTSDCYLQIVKNIIFLPILVLTLQKLNSQWVAQMSYFKVEMHPIFMTVTGHSSLDLLNWETYSYTRGGREEPNFLVVRI